jgi:type I restriction enzyme S subunit
MTSLKKVKLGDIAEITTGFPFKGSGYSNLGIRVVRGENVSLGQLRWDTIKCWNHPFSQVEKYSLNENDVVIGMDGSRVGRNKAQIKKNDLPLLLAQRVAKVKVRLGYSQTLIAYIIKSPLFEKYVEKVQTGTSIPHISQTQIEDFKFDIISDYKTQCSIAEILSSLDDKIELNNKINQELESLAQLLFKRWFVDFEFPNENGKPYKSSGGEMIDSELGQIPKGWRLGKFGELVDVINGYAFKSKDFDNSQEEGIVKIKNINGLTVDIKNTDFVSSNVVSNLNRKFKINSGDILIAMTGAEVGKIGVVPETKQNLWLNQRVGKVVPKDVKNTSFIHTLYNFLNLTDVVKNEAMGSAQPNISSTGIESIKILIPAQVVIEEFSRIFNDKYFLFVSSLAEIQTLSELRDTLLPKLISGELQIKEN